MKQDGKEFSPISEANPESLLQQAADGELVLFATARRHTAQLHAFPWVVTPKQSNRSRAAGLVPIGSELASDLLFFPDSQLRIYLATDPTDCPDTHPWKDHYWVLDEPQTITREQLYSQAAPATNVKAATVITTNTDTWVASARRIGQKIHNQNPKLNMEKVAQKTYDVMVENNVKREPGMTGRGGRVPTAATIKRHALTGIKS
jgi:hypothetical protein